MRYQFIKHCVFLILVFVCSYTIIAQDTDTTTEDFEPAYYRDYQFLIGGWGDVQNAVTNSRTLSKMLFDAYYRLAAPAITNTFLRESIGALWSFSVTWLSSMAPHELGHFFRANEVNATFWIEGLGFPGPVGHIVFPATKTKEDELAFVTGGIEVNTLYAMNVQKDWYRYNGLFNDEIFVTLFHRIIFPAYAFFVDPAVPANWRDANGNDIALGDVASVARLVFERQNKPVLLTDGSVNPELVTYYNATKWVSLLVNLLDLNTYYEAAALFSGETNGKNAPWLFGNSTWGYSYGLFTTVAQLGTEIYFYNYAALNRHSVNIYLRYGFPLKNMGIGLTLFDLVKFSFLSLDMSIHLWTQEYCDFGGAVEGTLYIPLTKRWSLCMLGRWKTLGYMLGLPIKEGFSAMAGILYNW
ncbi:MAG TPA: hypothetical protein P5519_05155 [Spirochaetia bacterium]|nr:hypothetical protein [Spirochaetales bacterium]HRS65259.1 hypothetical protein [Spirochaetia bacterium]